MLVKARNGGRQYAGARHVSKEEAGVGTGGGHGGANGSRLGTRARPEQTRQEILSAALREFAREGLAGARTDAIARAAGVNKALISYYFGGKAGLYSAALDHVFSQLVRVLNEVLDQDLRPGEKVLAYAAAHFDFMARAPMLPRLVHREMMQAGRVSSEHVERIATEYLQPLFRRLATVLVEGMEAGEFRRVDPAQFLISMVGAIVHYFASATILRAITQVDPYAPERLAARRAAVLEFIAAGLFAPQVTNAERNTQ
jgi:TetR/AcrR family transcriptional regulator